MDQTILELTEVMIEAEEAMCEEHRAGVGRIWICVTCERQFRGVRGESVGTRRCPDCGSRDITS